MAGAGTGAEARQSCFGDIAARRKPGSRLITSDLYTDDTAAAFGSVMDLWLDVLNPGGQSEASRTHYRQAYGKQFGGHGPDAVAQMIEAGGFSPPAPVFRLP